MIPRGIQREHVITALQEIDRNGVPPGRKSASPVAEVSLAKIGRNSSLFRSSEYFCGPQLCERRFDELEILIVYIDGIRFDEHHVMVALGVDPKGEKHLLGVREGATENSVVVTELLEDLVARGLSPRQRRWFVIDGSKALRAAIERVFGEKVPVQR